jgi:hypothetical protein
MGLHRHNFALALVSGLPVVAAFAVGLRFVARYRRGIRFAWGQYQVCTSEGLGPIAC